LKISAPQTMNPGIAGVQRVGYESRRTFWRITALRSLRRPAASFFLRRSDGFS